MRFFTNFLCFAVLLFASCQNADTSSKTATSSDTAKPAAAAPAAKAADGKKYTLTPVNSGVEFPNAKIEYSHFSNGQFGFKVDNYQLGAQTTDAGDLMCANSGKGQHIHLIFDDAPYSAQYSNIFDYSKEDGRYYMLAFLGKSYHESIKTPGAFVAHSMQIWKDMLIKCMQI